MVSRNDDKENEVLKENHSMFLDYTTKVYHWERSLVASLDKCRVRMRTGYFTVDREMPCHKTLRPLHRTTDLLLLNLF